MYDANEYRLGKDFYKALKRDRKWVDPSIDVSPKYQREMKNFKELIGKFKKEKLIIGPVDREGLIQKGKMFKRGDNWRKLRRYTESTKKGKKK